MAAPPYKYEKLPDANSIRLLRLIPRPSSEAVLIGSLVPCRLSGFYPNYTSLSYSWGRNSDGDVSMSRTVFLDGCGVAITENLHDFLLQISEPDADIIPLLWIDAICIDQKNLQERSAQVSIMAKIYSKASNLIIWLGRGVNESEDRKAMDALKLVRPAQDWLISRNDNMPEQLRASGKDGLCMPRYQRAIANLCQRRYFQRRWVMQEIHCAKPDSTVLAWGAFRMKPRDSMLAATGMQYLVSKESMDGTWSGSNSVEEFIDEDEASMRTMSQVLHLNMHYQPSARLRGTERMLDCLFKFQDTDCGDDRDRIYSLLSFAGDRFSLKADYSLTTSEVYIVFAGTMTEEGWIDTLLTLASWQLQNDQRSETVDELPSWCPDFRYHIREEGKRNHSEPKKVAHYISDDLPKPRVLCQENMLEIRAKIGRLLPEEIRDAALKHEMVGLREGDYICQIAERENNNRFIMRSVKGAPDHFVLVGSWKSKIAGDSPYIWKNCSDVAARTVRLV